MKFRVYYIDDEAGARKMEGNLAEAAAWRFVRDVPREGDPQVTVETLRTDGSAGISHYHAGTLLAAASEPVREPYPMLSMRRYHEGGEGFIIEVCGSHESLRLFAAKLSRSLEQGNQGSSFGLPIENADSPSPTDTLIFKVVDNFAASVGKGGSFLERFRALQEEFDTSDREFRDRLWRLNWEFSQWKDPPAWWQRMGRWLASMLRGRRR